MASRRERYSISVGSLKRAVNLTLPYVWKYSRLAWRRLNSTVADAAAMFERLLFFLLNFLRHSRQHISRPHFAELRDALADEETYALIPSHRARDLLRQQRLD